nr:hypothetical protein BaRGS_021754 [Batillaria attramentaria]
MLIASRGGASKDPDVASVRSIRPYQGRYYYDRSNDRSSYLSTPKNMFDPEVQSIRTHGYKSTRFNGEDSVRYYNYSNPRVHGLYSEPRHVETKLAPVYFITPPPREPRRFFYARPRPRYPDDPYLEPSLCHVILKLLQLVTCLVIIVITRTGHADLSLDITLTMFGVIGFLVAGVSLVLIWIKGHPVPGDCLHTTMFLCYAITVPVLLTGAILVLTQDDKNDYVAAVSVMFFLAVILFTFDLAFTSIALLFCTCCSCVPYEQGRGARTTRVSPWRDRFDYDDYPDRYYDHRRTHNGFGPKDYSYPSLRDSYYYSSPRTLPQMRPAELRYPGY